MIAATSGIGGPNGQGAEVFLVLCVVTLIVCGIYIFFWPSVVAYDRNHRNKSGIVVLNLFFGWSLIGWVGALIWALNNDSPTVIVASQNAVIYNPEQVQQAPYVPSKPPSFLGQ